ncbi:MAG: hypothetical protein JWM05_3295 [Acidimicrobiales bacterium]|nr:hypothetical protein [Acidimicrobiales bacterium]
MRRCIVVLGLAVALVAASSCSSGKDRRATRGANGPVAATVGTSQITAAEIEADLAAESKAAKQAKTKADPNNPLTAPQGKRPGTYTPAATAAVVTNRVVSAIYAEELVQHKLRVGTADRAQARFRICADSKGKVPKAPACPPLDVYPRAYRDFTLTLEERQVASSRSLYGRAYDELRRSSPKSLQVVCAAIMPVTDQATADAVVAGVRAGQTMEAAAAPALKAKKAQPAQSGCLFAAIAPPELVAAKTGQVVAVSTQAGRFVARPVSRKQATQLEFTTTPPTDDPAVRAAIQAQIDALLRKVKVTVQSRYGHWDPVAFAVRPPGASGATTTTTHP